MFRYSDQMPAIPGGFWPMFQLRQGRDGFVTGGAPAAVEHWRPCRGRAASDGPWRAPRRCQAPRRKHYARSRSSGIYPTFDPPPVVRLKFSTQRRRSRKKFFGKRNLLLSPSRMGDGPGDARSSDVGVGTPVFLGPPWCCRALPGAPLPIERAFPSVCALGFIDPSRSRPAVRPLPPSRKRPTPSPLP